MRDPMDGARVALHLATGVTSDLSGGAAGRAGATVALFSVFSLCDRSASPARLFSARN